MQLDMQSQRTPAAELVIPMFGPTMRSLWFLLLAGTLFSELVPLTLEFESHFSTLTFHSYEVIKLVAFFVFGLLTPLAWWRYKTLGWGVLFSISCTAVVELGQAFIPGHRLSGIELVVKLTMLFLGFATALDFRKYQVFRCGRLCIRFFSRHWDSANS
jgi:hypothetical protein